MEVTIAIENNNTSVRTDDGPRINEAIKVKEVRLIDENGEKLMDFVLSIASGKQTKTEQKGFREISIFKDGVVL